MTTPARVIVGISGASGAIYGVRALEMLRQCEGVESHLVMSQAAGRTIAEETDVTPAEVKALAHVVHDNRDIGASIASGSFVTAGMLVAPCSIKSLSGIVHGYADNLLIRAADVCLKERRTLVLMLRETPLHPGHLELASKAASYGAVVMPPVPAFYHRPKTVDDIVNQSVGRALDMLGLHTKFVSRWKDADGGT